MAQSSKKVKKNRSQQIDSPTEKSGKGPSNRGSESKADVQIAGDTTALLQQLVSNLQELHVWEGTLLQKLNKIIDKHH